MIDIKALEKNQEDPRYQVSYLDYYKKSLIDRGEDPALADRLLELNQKRKNSLASAESNKAEINKISQEVGKKKKAGEDASDLVAKVHGLREMMKTLESEAEAHQENLMKLLYSLPNHLHPSTPKGESSEDNKLIREVGERTSFSFQPKLHFEVAEGLGLLDFERAAKVTGARFAYLLGSLARLERALISFMLDLHTQELGYTEMLPPFLANGDSLLGTGQLPKFAQDLFKVEEFPFYLIPTAEVPITNFYRDEILDAEDLPRRFAAYSPCFRSEAGSHGRDTRGLIRQHQFNKVELMIFAHPDKSYEEHERLTQNAEEVLKRLELPYRVMQLCSKDIGFGAAKCYDLEVWLPSQALYREISSCSNFEDFQARRAQIRFREKGGKPQFVHTLNGSGLAVGRTAVAILENFQTESGQVKIPKALRPYMGGAEFLTPFAPH